MTFTDTDLAGQTALVTGATSGIGRAAAVRLARRGAHVLVSGRDAERGDAVVTEIRAAAGKADFVAADLADGDSVRALARRAAELGGGHVDILVNNAGVFPFGPTQGASDEDIDTVYAVNVKAPFILTGELAPAMAARGKGSIINVLTMVAHFGVAGMALYGSSKAALTLLTKAWSAEFGMAQMALYGSSKAALVLLTKSWAAEYGPSGVRVNAVSPGPTRTEGTEVMGDQLDQLAALAPAGRPAAPEEIASAISYLAGDQASFVHGAVLDVDGGRNAA
ncbi:MAG TPA: SDR family NAD(P)-dependent oxidoreductase [Streptosporangiaceae bacterium]|nr:SDR family NAD(P)-dependent oxidoreductase [Streptosporangiaceae bacterium]